MTIEKLFEEIETDTSAIKQLDFTYSKTKKVPYRDDKIFLFERGLYKSGKTLRSCVIYVDIRNSVALTKKHHTQTMGRIYSAFTKAMLKIAQYHDGAVRNIIGDRVMIVFPSENCFTNAIDCAISINQSCEIINKVFSDVDFECGIGIDYGDLNIIKVGLPRQGAEGLENKSLVWAGYPANIASRLTDVANKKNLQLGYTVTVNPRNPCSIKPFPLSNIRRPPSSLLSLRFPLYDPNAPLYLDKEEELRMTPSDLASYVAKGYEPYCSNPPGNIINIKQDNKAICYPPILIIENVLKGLKKENPERKSIKRNLWKEYSVLQGKDISCKIYGGNIKWKM